MRLPRKASLLLLALLLTPAATAHAESAWVVWKHSYEVWVDGNKNNHLRDVAWRKASKTSTKSDCNDRALSEARAEYDTLTGKGVRATLAGTDVGFDQRGTRFTHGYRRFECWPDSVDPRRAKER